MQGLVVTGRPVGEVVQAALGKGLLIISAGSDVLRLVPPLIITEKEIDRLCDILRPCSRRGLNCRDTGLL